MLTDRENIHFLITIYIPKVFILGFYFVDASLCTIMFNQLNSEFLLNQRKIGLKRPPTTKVSVMRSTYSAFMLKFTFYVLFGLFSFGTFDNSPSSLFLFSKKWMPGIYFDCFFFKIVFCTSLYHHFSASEYTFIGQCGFPRYTKHYIYTLIVQK